MSSVKYTRVEQTVVRQNHPMFKVIEDFSIRSNNFYNYANYIVRQEYFKNNNAPSYLELQNTLKHHETYKHLMSQSSQCVLRLLEKNWRSFFRACKVYNKDSSQFLGEPKIPKYKPKGSRFIWMLKNNQTYIKDGHLYFRLKAMNGYGFKTSVTDRLLSVRFIPRNDVFVLEIVYDKEIPKPKQEFNDNIVAIDLGVNNFVTMSNNIGLQPVIIKGGIIKSINQYYNKSRAKYQSELPKGVHWSKRLDRLTNKRFWRIKNYIHHTSKYIVEYCIANRIDNVVVGNNDFWKQEVNIGKQNNQNFVCIPYEMLIKQLQYKCEDAGLNLVLTEEDYTSTTSFLDGELPVEENVNKRRRKRGIFKSNDGVLINADINASYQIGLKVFPNAYNSYGTVGCLNPIVINNPMNCFS